MTHPFPPHRSPNPMTDDTDTPFGRALAATVIATGGRLMCCDQPMKDVGECSQGCCDYYRCEVCGHHQTCEYGD
jgi:hypothetical protein